MSMTPTLFTVPQAEVVRQLPMPPIAYGSLALLGFLILLAVLWAFRNTGQKTGQGDGGGPAHTDQVQRS